jgi:hypothetical protein
MKGKVAGKEVEAIKGCKKKGKKAMKGKGSP